MDILIEFIVGTSGNPVEIAVRFLMFVLIIDSIFGFANNLINGARR